MPAEITKIDRKIKRLKETRKQHLEKALEGFLDIALLRAPQIRRFVLAYQVGDDAHAVYGMALPGYDAEGEDEEKLDRYTIYLDDSNIAQLWCKYRSLRRLKASLSDYPHVIRFLDEDEDRDA